MAVFQDPPHVVDGIDGADHPVRLLDATVAIGADELAELAREATVVLTGPLADAVAAARLVPDLGPAVVVEVEVPRGAPLDRAPFDDLAALGLAAGAHLVGDADPVPGDTDAAGWEIGMVTALLAEGVRTIRGVEPRRLHRLVAVCRAMEGAAAP